jgi:hypothetical protein
VLSDSTTATPEEEKCVFACHVNLSYFTFSWRCSWMWCRAVGFKGLIYRTYVNSRSLKSTKLHDATFQKSLIKQHFTLRHSNWIHVGPNASVVWSSPPTRNWEVPVSNLGRKQYILIFFLGVPQFLQANSGGHHLKPDQHRFPQPPFHFIIQQPLHHTVLPRRWIWKRSLHVCKRILWLTYLLLGKDLETNYEYSRYYAICD